MWKRHSAGKTINLMQFPLCNEEFNMSGIKETGNIMV